MNIFQLEYALALKKYKSYVRAAKALGISQPGLSIQIKNLEEELDLVIFDRSKKSIETTEKGILFLERAQLLVNESYQLRKYANQLNNQFTGELKIGIIPTLAPYILPLFINQLNETYKNLKIHIKESLTEEIIHEIKSGELDGGIISTPIQSKVEFNMIPLFYEGFMLFVSRDHPLFLKDKVSIKDIPLNDVWLLKEGNCFRDQVENICEFSNKKSRRELFYFESTSIESLCRIVEFRGGITFLPELTTLHLSTDREEMLKDISGRRQVREISLVHLPNHIHHKDLKQLGEIITQNLPKNLLHKGDARAVPTAISL